ncbi:mechanosensitive ion channel family protein [Chitinophaga niabensis]|uniref:Small-conductance mechanosensitive channel n=1 Tax=Chitinophaga niabensis TaxID=536979 RepID=A0A1N6EBR1_9BACT|nr:mechanosensitive ion channel domain-containing protein [Chitinophaga niabensis]SIN80357.1 Small-conductance mechanosensitive channel [Chitinophaga niabensis]
MVTDQATYNKKKFRNEILIFIVKLVVYFGVLYVNLTQHTYFEKYNWLGRMANALSLFLGANILISIGWIVLISWYLRKNRLQRLTRDNFVLGLNRISSVLNTVVFLVALMNFTGLNLKETFFSLSIAAAAFALLTKEYVANMINGLIIMFSDQLSLGDQIRVGEYKGKVLDITLINVVLQNDDDDIVLIPNSVIFSSMVLNQSKQNIKKLTIEFELDLKYQSSPDMLERELKASLRPYASNITENSFSLKILEIKKDLVHYKVQFLIPRPDKETERKMRRMLINTILSFSGREINEQENAD